MPAFTPRCVGGLALNLRVLVLGWPRSYQDSLWVTSGARPFRGSTDQVTLRRRQARASGRPKWPMVALLLATGCCWGLNAQVARSTDGNLEVWLTLTLLGFMA